MAGADYYSCEKCGGKTFYDADLSYGAYGEDNFNPDTKSPWPDGNVGDMAVICKECAKKFKIQIIERA